MRNPAIRTRYFVFASAMYLLLGAIIVARALSAHAAVAVVFGLILIALGAVRLRDFRSWRAGRR